MSVRTTVARLFRLTSVSTCIVGFAGAAPGALLPAQQPIVEFLLLNAAPGTLVSLPVASNTGFDPKHVVAVGKMETYLSKVLAEFRRMGFAEPLLESTDGRSGGQAFVIRVHDYPDSITHARYSPDGLYMEIDLSRAIDGDNVTDPTMEALAHELFHAVQRAYKGSNADHGSWIVEGQAQAIGMDVTRALSGVDVHAGTGDDYRLGGREYFRPLATNVHDETYRTASFWRYLSETVATDYNYLARLYNVPFTSVGGDDADLRWLDRALRASTGNGLAHHYAQFAATLAGYMPSRLTTTPSGTAEQVRDRWLTRLFAPCPSVTLTATSISGTTTVPLRQNGSRCVEIHAPEDVVVQARSPNRSGLEALWLGRVGEKDAEPAYVGRGADGYVGDWKLSMKAGVPRTVVISNMADDPTQSINQDVTLTVYTSAARMAGATGGVGGPIDLDFDRFSQREILSAQTEQQLKAGITRPCMIRLHMRHTGQRVDLALQLDNDGPIQPGTFSVVAAAAPELVAGQFIGGFNFGSGRDRVSYQAEGGTVTLTGFSPNLLRGTARLLGRLPKRGFGQAESSWPETMSVQAEFTVVPRVNLGSALLSENFCFGEA